MKLNISTINNPIIDILVAVAARGGGENCINMLGKYLCGKGFRVRVIQMVYEGTDWAEDCMEFHYVYPSREDHDLHDFIEGYTAFLKDNDKPQLILATAWPMMAYVAKRTASELGQNITVASWLHAPLQMYEESGFGGGDFIKYADIHFAISNEIANEIRKADPEAVVYRINNPADLSKIHMVENTKPGTLLYVGRLSEEKNIGIILCAIAVAKTDWKLRLVGEGDEKKKLKKLAKELNIENKIEFIGWSDDPWKYAEGCYGLVLSSMYEGSPLVAIEAMSCGLPVMANVSSRVNEIITPGQNGFIYPDNEPKELAKILDMVSNGMFSPIDTEYCRQSVVDYDAKVSLFDFFVKLYVTINKRTLGQYLNKTQDYIIKDKIDVIVPCYNVENYISRCLDSIICQTIGMDHLKVIVVNDASTDGTLNVLKEYESRFPDNICIVDCETNAGPGYARNLGMQYVTEKYMSFVDSDDCIRSDMFEKMYLLDKCYPSNVITCDYEAFVSEVPKEEELPVSTSSLSVIENDLERRQLFYDNAFENPVWGKLYRTDFIKEHEDICFPLDVKMEDIYFTYMVVAHAKVWQHVTLRLYNYFLNDSGIMKSSVRNNYYMNVHQVYAATMEKFKDIGLFETLKLEAAYVYYNKVFKDISAIVESVSNESQEENVVTMIEYIKTAFPEICDNPYIEQHEKEELKRLLNVEGQE